MQINEILIKPLMTEKATGLAALKIYTFQVNSKANKNQIKQAVEKLFLVKVDKVRIVFRQGKLRKVGRQSVPKKTPDRKIAYIGLKTGKIDLFPQA